MWNYACLNSGLRVEFNGEAFESKNGLLDFLIREVGDDAIYEPAYITGIAPGSKDFVLLLMDRADEVFYTYSSTVNPS